MGSRPAAGQARAPQADRAGLFADRGPVVARRAEGGGGGARPAPGIAGSRSIRRCGSGADGPSGETRSAGRAFPGVRGRSVADHPSERLAYEEIFAASSRVALVRARAIAKGAGDRRHRRIDPTGRSGARLSLDQRAASRDGRDHRGDGAAAAHGAALTRRCWQRQDGRRADRMLSAIEGGGQAALMRQPRSSPASTTRPCSAMPRRPASRSVL
jgi:hypothetical protein